ncbi:uncharacterized protein BDW70DRAFT_139968 [Aspergillus foveolatus]|uniref:uncharacterized protein n=1 Tax=Aspergillus foveolatus TaxID=210207 RepID=UPI003CCE0763
MRVLDVVLTLCFVNTAGSRSLRILLTLNFITTSLPLFHIDPGFVYDGAQVNKMFTHW